VRPERRGPVEFGLQFGRVGVAVALGDALGVARLLCSGEQRGDWDLGGKVADACRLGVSSRDELFRAGDVDALDQVVFGVGDAFAREGDAGGVAVGEVECLGGGAVDPGP
jgi:hypothetical protein